MQNKAEGQDTVELFDKTKESQLTSFTKAHESLPNYSIRKMRKNVINKHSLYTRLPLAILCAIYQDLTGNAINNSNLISKEINMNILILFKDCFSSTSIDDIPQIFREYSLQIKRLPREILINYILYQIHKFQVTIKDFQFTIWT
ncbi:unnamed protein product [Rhizophagus irregularis]|nr:unnamed protein product [Rhizophagus irregularis]